MEWLLGLKLLEPIYIYIYSFDGHFQDEEIIEYCTYNKCMTCCDCGKRIMSYDEFMTHYAIDELTGKHLKQ